MVSSFFKFHKFWSIETNTENTMSDLYFSGKIVYSQKKACDKSISLHNSPITSVWARTEKDEKKQPLRGAL